MALLDNSIIETQTQTIVKSQHFKTPLSIFILLKTVVRRETQPSFLAFVANNGLEIWIWQSQRSG